MKNLNKKSGIWDHNQSSGKVSGIIQYNLLGGLSREVYENVSPEVSAEVSFFIRSWLRFLIFDNINIPISRDILNKIK